VSGLKRSSKHLVEVISPVFALNAIPARCVASAVQVPLHFFADANVLRLNLFRDYHAFAHEVFGCSFRKEEIEDHAAAVHA